MPGDIKIVRRVPAYKYVAEGIAYCICFASLDSFLCAKSYSLNFVYILQTGPKSHLFVPKAVTDNMHPNKKQRTERRPIFDPVALKTTAQGSSLSNPPSVAGSVPNLKTAEKAPAAEDEFDVDAVSDGESCDSDTQISTNNNNSNNNDTYNDVSSSNPSENSGSDADDSLDDILNQSGPGPSKKRKRNDPKAFALSMNKILGSHLTTKSRSDPVLVRSKAKAQVVDENKLEAKARRVLAAQKRLELEKGRVRDVLPKGNGGEASRVLEKEKALRKIAQRGVVKLFNAVRAAQVQQEEAQAEVRKKGFVGLGNREQKGGSLPRDVLISP